LLRKDELMQDASDRINTAVAHPARLYDYLLGGKDNFQVDRDAAERAYANYPGRVAGVRQHALAQRSYLQRSVRTLAQDFGIRQFLDIGTGIPTENNTHEVAQRVAPDSRVVYVDNDPIVLVHARALLTSTPEGRTAYIDGDLHDVDAVLNQAAETLDFDQPIAVSLLGILHFFRDEDAYRSARQLIDGMPSGSYLSIAQLASDVLPEMTEACRKMSESFPVPCLPRSRSEVARFFDGLELLEPGVVQVHHWRPGSDDLPASTSVPVHVGLAQKPQ
jgi:hypothetical protein